MSNSNHLGQVVTFERRVAAKRDLDLEIREVGDAAARTLWATGSAGTAARTLWATGSAQASTRTLWATGSAHNSMRTLWATGSAGSAKAVASVAA